MRQCKKCNEIKFLIDFNVDRKRKDGLHPYCKKCQSDYSKVRRQARSQAKAVNVTEKQCSLCKEVKPPTDFYSDVNNASGLSSNCKKCRREKHLLERYGINVETYDIMYERQNGKCRICGLDCSTGRMLAVDHCHETGQVRGLLCTRCNNALGCLKDDIELMKSMIKYIEENESTCHEI